MVTDRARRAALAASLLVALLHCPGRAVAKAGPPYLTNDPGTPGNGNLEINLVSMQTIARGMSAYQVPQIDVNFGVGDRIQLTYEIPYVFQESSGQTGQTDGAMPTRESNGAFWTGARIVCRSRFFRRS